MFSKSLQAVCWKDLAGQSRKCWFIEHLWYFECRRVSSRFPGPLKVKYLVIACRNFLLIAGSWAQIGNNSSQERTQKMMRNLFYVISPFKNPDIVTNVLLVNPRKIRRKLRTPVP